MIHALRSLAVLIHNPWAKPENPLKPFHYSFRVMPWDCDINIHLTNGRYPQRMDHARTDFFLRIGGGLLFAHKNWRSVLASQTITFIREIKPFSLVDIESRVLYWDAKYFYMEHRFLVNGRLHAKTIARIAMLKMGKVKSFDSFLSAIANYHELKSNVPSSPVIAEGSAISGQVQRKMDLLVEMRKAEAEHEALLDEQRVAQSEGV